MSTNTTSPYDDYLNSLPGADYLVLGLDDQLQALWGVSRTVPWLQLNINEALTVFLEGLNDHESPLDYIDDLIARISETVELDQGDPWQTAGLEVLVAGLKRFLLQTYLQLCQAVGTEDGIVTYRLHSWFDPVSLVLEKYLESGFTLQHPYIDQVITFRRILPAAPIK